jgi:hypothetical protein
MHDSRLFADLDHHETGRGTSAAEDSVAILKTIDMPYRAVRPSRHLAKTTGRLLRLVSTGQGRAAAPKPSLSAALMPSLDFMPRNADFMPAS